MPTRSIPVTTYRISAGKPDQKWGSPAALPLATAAHRVLIKVPIDKIPADATITSAILQFYADRDVASGKNIRVTAPSEAWTSSVTWTTQPAVGAVLDTDTTATTAAGEALPGLDVTTWAVTRSRLGLRLESTSALPAWWVRGSSGADAQPVLIVEYAIIPETPGNLRPDGGAVSVASPILTYAGDEDMTLQKIQYSTTGSDGDIDYDSGWIAATEGYFDPAIEAGAEPVLTNGGAGIWWRAITDGPEGESEPSEWAYYEYNNLPTTTITYPPATTDDGAPNLTWTTSGQTAWKAEFWHGGKLADSSGWRNETGTRNWNPSGSVRVPDGNGRFILWVRDNVSPRVAATDAPTVTRLEHSFTTVIEGAGPAVNEIEVNFDDPIPVISGVRDLGEPDEVRLFRDGVGVPLWTNDGSVYQNWAPAGGFFTGTLFSIRDNTAALRSEPVYHIRIRTSGVVSLGGPSASIPLFTSSVWLVDPRTDEQIEIQGWGDVPTVQQETSEQSILHAPINDGLIVEPKRRRIVRSTRYGSIEGVVLNEDEALLEEWINAGSNLKYRLIFGKVNWPVIIGDYSPVDTFYADGCGDDHVLVSLNWWQRLSDV